MRKALGLRTAFCGFLMVLMFSGTANAVTPCDLELEKCVEGVAEIELAYGLAIEAATSACYATCGDGSGLTKFCQSICSTAANGMEKAAAKRIMLKLNACDDNFTSCLSSDCGAGEEYDVTTGSCCPAPLLGEACECTGSKVNVNTMITGDDGCLLSTSCGCMRKCPLDSKLGISTVTSCSCSKGMSLDEELGVCCPDHLFIPSCAPCPDGWDGGLNEVHNDAGCLIGYTCYCEEPDATEECMSDEDCEAGNTCTAAVDCLPCESCPNCTVCCGVCEPAADCTEEQCGPMPALPSVLCEDGSTAGLGACEKQEDGKCGWTVTECPDSGCQDDSDCGEGSWCRPICGDGGWAPGGVSECVPYQPIGEPCGGFTPICAQMKCEPGVSCVDMDPLMVDEPGICGGKPGPCEPGVEEVSCLVDPCKGTLCKAYPEAKCIANYCGGCNAEFFVDGEMVDCSKPPTTCSYGGETYMPGDEFPGVGNDWCNSCFCDEAGNVACTKILCGPAGCESDNDCDESSWCRPTCAEGTFDSSGQGECVPYQMIGEPCGGFTPLCFQMLCEPGVQCVDMNPLIADEPGICGGGGPVTCEYGGETYMPGDGFPGVGDDWCNACFCDDEGNVACTKILCGPEISCEYGGETYMPGDDFPGVGDDWCNECFCDEGGNVACTKILCGPNGCEVDGQTFEVGESFPGTGNNWCNTCFCGENGMVACTEMACGPQGCESNADCANGEWCRPTCDDSSVSECVPFQTEGGICGGYTLPCAFEMCGEGLQCVVDDEFGMIPDMPGTCEVPCVEVNCFVDPCSVTTCDAYPNATCTANYCGGCNAEFYVKGVLVDCDEGGASTCDYMGATYELGESFNGVEDNWCNTCTCLDTGAVSCTKKACLENPCQVTGCSGEVCHSEPIVSTCDWSPEYECYSTVGNCGPFGDGGACMWDNTTSLAQCKADSEGPTILPKSDK